MPLVSPGWLPPKDGTHPASRLGMSNPFARRLVCSLALIAGLGACDLTPSPFEGQHFKLESFGHWGDSFEWEAPREV